MPAYYAFFGYFFKIPPLVWSGMVGAIVALCGVMINNHFQFKSQTRALTAAEKEKSLDRVMALRKEVYLPLAGSIPAVLVFLAKLATAKEIDDTPLAEFSLNAAKLAIVSETETAILATEASVKLGIAHMELFVFAQPAIASMAATDDAKKYRVAATQKAEQVQTRIDELLQSGKWDAGVLDALQRNQQYHYKRQQEHWTIENAALRQHSIHAIAFTRKLIQGLPELNRLAAQLMLALRNDMGQKTDEAAFNRAYADQSAHMIAVLEKMLQQLEREMATDANENGN